MKGGGVVEVAELRMRRHRVLDLVGALVEVSHPSVVVGLELHRFERPVLVVHLTQGAVQGEAAIPVQLYEVHLPAVTLQRVEH